MSPGSTSTAPRSVYSVSSCQSPRSLTSHSNNSSVTPSKRSPAALTPPLPHAHALPKDALCYGFELMTPFERVASLHHNHVVRSMNVLVKAHLTAPKAARYKPRAPAFHKGDPEAARTVRKLTEQLTVRRDQVRRRFEQWRRRSQLFRGSRASLRRQLALWRDHASTARSLHARLLRHAAAAAWLAWRGAAEGRRRRALAAASRRRRSVASQTVERRGGEERRLPRTWGRGNSRAAALSPRRTAMRGLSSEFDKAVDDPSSPSHSPSAAASPRSASHPSRSAPCLSPQRSSPSASLPSSPFPCPAPQPSAPPTCSSDPSPCESFHCPASACLSPSTSRPSVDPSAPSPSPPASHASSSPPSPSSPCSAALPSCSSLCPSAALSSSTNPCPSTQCRSPSPPSCSPPHCPSSHPSFINPCPSTPCRARSASPPSCSAPLCPSASQPFFTNPHPSTPCPSQGLDSASHHSASHPSYSPHHPSMHCNSHSPSPHSHSPTLPPAPCPSAHSPHSSASPRSRSPSAFSRSRSRSPPPPSPPSPSLLFAERNGSDAFHPARRTRGTHAAAFARARHRRAPPRRSRRQPWRACLLALLAACALLALCRAAALPSHAQLWVSAERGWLSGARGLARGARGRLRAAFARGAEAVAAGMEPRVRAPAAHTCPGEDARNRSHSAPEAPPSELQEQWLRLLAATVDVPSSWRHFVEYYLSDRASAGFTYIPPRPPMQQQPPMPIPTLSPQPTDRRASPDTAVEHEVSVSEDGPGGEPRSNMAENQHSSPEQLSRGPYSDLWRSLRRMMELPPACRSFTMLSMLEW
ncbi:hypothetical protein AB1Y20_005311 [Prymnesium parvum]|uniref:Uncharacterized protein n=1 Tax=Prymnesium parvum TaxID=97485 RepID=A0AB34J3X0_PRYPA